MKQAAQINEQLVTGKCSINEAREKCGLPPIEDGDSFITKAKSDNSTCVLNIGE